MDIHAKGGEGEGGGWGGRREYSKLHLVVGDVVEVETHHDFFQIQTKLGELNAEIPFFNPNEFPGFALEFGF